MFGYILGKPELIKVKQNQAAHGGLFGIDVFKTARANGFGIDTKRETFGRPALVLVE
jgi:hypothetical protein